MISTIPFYRYAEKMGERLGRKMSVLAKKTTDQTSHSPRYPNASTNTRYE